MAMLPLFLALCVRNPPFTGGFFVQRNSNADLWCQTKLAVEQTIQWPMIWDTMKIISMGYCKKDVTPLLTHWSYVFLALTHHVMLLWGDLMGNILLLVSVLYQNLLDIPGLLCTIGCLIKRSSLTFHELDISFSLAQVGDVINIPFV